MMCIRWLCDWPPRYRAGQCLEVDDRFGSHFVARAMAQTVTAADVRDYARTMETIDRYIDKRIGEPPRSAAAPVDPGRRPVRAAGKRVLTGRAWRAELGQQGPDVASILLAAREMQVTMAPSSIDDSDRTVSLVAATDTPIRRREYDFFGDNEMVYDEVLDMSPGAVRLERLNKGAALLDSQ
jgi:hypothetical protein